MLKMHFKVVRIISDKIIRSENILASCYRPQRSSDKVMFLHLSAILFTEGGSLSRGIQGGLCPGGPLSQRPPAAVRLRAGGAHPTGMHSRLDNMRLTLKF